MSSSPHERINRPQRILLVSLDNLGDVVFASSLTPPLLARFPDAVIDVWCKTYTADVARLIPHVRDVIASDPFWDKAPGRGKGKIGLFLHAVRRLRNQGYDTAILAAAPWRTAAAVAATGIPTRVGLGRRRNGIFLTIALPTEDIHRPVLAEMSRVLEPFGITPEHPHYRLDAAALRERVMRLAPKLLSDTARPLLALHPFASKRDRCVSLDDWRAAANAMRARRFTVLWIGSGREMEELRSGVADSEWRFIDRVGDGSLADTAAALSMASLFAGHDSGPLHIASAFGVPVLGVFAPGEPRRTFPQGVGPWRMIAQPSPRDVSADDIVRELSALTAIAPRSS
jgi:ADP-heptose:LPS heptosyltransferase